MNYKYTLPLGLLLSLDVSASNHDYYYDLLSKGAPTDLEDADYVPSNGCPVTQDIDSVSSHNPLVMPDKDFVDTGKELKRLLLNGTITQEVYDEIEVTRNKKRLESLSGERLKANVKKYALTSEQEDSFKSDLLSGKINVQDLLHNNAGLGFPSIASSRVHSSSSQADGNSRAQLLKKRLQNKQAKKQTPAVKTQETSEQKEDLNAIVAQLEKEFGTGKKKESSKESKRKKTAAQKREVKAWEEKQKLIKQQEQEEARKAAIEKEEKKKQAQREAQAREAEKKMRAKKQEEERKSALEREAKKKEAQAREAERQVRAKKEEKRTLLEQKTEGMQKNAKEDFPPLAVSVASNKPMDLKEAKPNVTVAPHAEKPLAAQSNTSPSGKSTESVQTEKEKGKISKLLNKIAPKKQKRVKEETDIKSEKDKEVIAKPVSNSTFPDRLGFVYNQTVRNQSPLPFNVMPFPSAYMAPVYPFPHVPASNVSYNMEPISSREGLWKPGTDAYHDNNRGVSLISQVSESGKRITHVQHPNAALIGEIGNKLWRKMKTLRSIVAQVSFDELNTVPYDPEMINELRKFSSSNTDSFMHHGDTLHEAENKALAGSIDHLTAILYKNGYAQDEKGEWYKKDAS